MRRTKTGRRNLQDWDIKEHQNAGHALVAAPLVLAQSNIVTSACNLETAASALSKADEPYYAAQIQQMVNTLNAISVMLKAKEAK